MASKTGKAQAAQCLMLISALAEGLSDDLMNDKLWEGDAEKVLAQIKKELTKASNAISKTNFGGR